MRSRKLLLVVGVLALPLGSLSAAGAAGPRVDVDANVRYQPPEEEARITTSVEGLLPTPLVVEVYATHDREGNLDRPETHISTTIQGEGVEYCERYEKSEGSNPWPTDGMVTELAESTLDEICNETGLC